MVTFVDVLPIRPRSLCHYDVTSYQESLLQSAELDAASDPHVENHRELLADIFHFFGRVAWDESDSPGGLTWFSTHSLVDGLGM